MKAATALGFTVNPGTATDYLDLIQTSINRNNRIIILNHNMHSLYFYFRDREVRALYDNQYVMIDGMPIVWLMKTAGHKVNAKHRVTWVDFFWPLMERANAEGWKIFCVGSTEHVIAMMLQTVHARLPSIRIEGHHGYFPTGRNCEVEQRLVTRIKQFKPDLCLIGMGTPRQEYWSVTRQRTLDVEVLLTCGACFEYIAKTTRTPPRWMGQIGLEWSYRLIENPRRFAFRYLLEPWLLLVFWIKALVINR